MIEGGKEIVKVIVWSVVMFAMFVAGLFVPNVRTLALFGLVAIFWGFVVYSK